MTKADLNKIADKLFKALTAHDVDLFETMLAPKALIRQNNAPAVPFSIFKQKLERLPGIMGDHRYEKVQRVFGDHVIVEEHQVRSTTPKGVELDIAACVVVRVNKNGLVSHINEYLDPTPMMNLS